MLAASVAQAEDVAEGQTRDGGGRTSAAMSGSCTHGTAGGDVESRRSRTSEEMEEELAKGEERSPE